MIPSTMESVEHYVSHVCIHVHNHPLMLGLVAWSFYQENAFSTKSISDRSHLSLTAFRTSSLRLPVPQTLTAIAPICLRCSCATRAPTSGLPGNIWTLADGECISLTLRGRVTNSRTLSTSLRFSMVRICVIHGRIHSRCSGDWMIQTRITLRVAQVPFAKPATNERT